MSYPALPTIWLGSSPRWVHEMTTQDDDGVEVPLDLSAATSLVMRYQPPGTDPAQEFNATTTTDGVDGKLEHTVPAGVLTTTGTWKRQARAVIGGLTHRGDVFPFNVRTPI